MGNFNDAIEYVLGNEKGFVNNPNDAGGATNFGLSLRFLRSIDADRLKKYGIFGELTVNVIRELHVEQARNIYRGEFWEAAPFESVTDQLVCNYCLDMAVHHGINEAVKLVQRASWAVYRKRSYIRDDGIMGSGTLEVLNDLGDSFLPVLIAMRASYCRLLVEIRPKDKDFLDGWLDRCYKI
jgi:lysozyme family protein